MLAYSYRLLSPDLALFHFLNRGQHLVRLGNLLESVRVPSTIWMVPQGKLTKRSPDRPNCRCDLRFTRIKDEGVRNGISSIKKWFSPDQDPEYRSIVPL
jgi:hypothetical protein